MTSRRHEKSLPKVLAFEDGPFSKPDRYCFLVGVLVACNSIEQVLLDRIQVDGKDGTQKVVSLARRSKGAGVIMLPSVSLGGFNVIDPYRLHRRLRLPVIVANPERPRLRAVQEALRRHFPDWKQRVRVFDLMGSPDALHLGRNGVLYFYPVGIPATTARIILRHITYFGKKPEPLRIARILARALCSTPPFKTAGGV